MGQACMRLGMSRIQSDRFRKKFDALRHSRNTSVEEVVTLEKSLIPCRIDGAFTGQPGLFLRGELNLYFARNAASNVILQCKDVGKIPLILCSDQFAR